jgi:hypothetical protein
MMMRKTSLIVLGAAAGVAVTLIATPPRIVLDGARAQTAAADTYRQLSLFGDVFERVRADYVVVKSLRLVQTVPVLLGAKSEVRAMREMAERTQIQLPVVTHMFFSQTVPVQRSRSARLRLENARRS